MSIKINGIPIAGTGSRGKGAYQIAQENGYTGTEQEFNEALGSLTKFNEFTETDPTVPAWAKKVNKPNYTYDEVGAAPLTHTHNISDISGYTQPKFYRVILPADSWSQQATTRYTQIVSIVGLQETDLVIVSPAPDDIITASTYGIFCSEQKVDQLIFQSNGRATNDIVINIVVQNAMIDGGY